MKPQAMQMWQGRGEASGYKLRLIEVLDGGTVTFHRTAVPSPARLAIPGEVARCSVAQLEAAYEYEREATEADL